MKVIRAALLITACVIVVTGAGVKTVFASDLVIDWWTLDGGGGMYSTGGALELSGTVGQPDAGVVLTGGSLELVGGFWPAFSGADEFCYGDLDDDGDIDLSDLATLLGAYGQTSGMNYEDGDLDGDGDVDLSDLAGLLGVYGTTCP
jgi:hypothetical protein